LLVTRQAQAAYGHSGRAHTVLANRRQHGASTHSQWAGFTKVNTDDAHDHLRILMG
jgi:hypothetical protein